MRPYHTVEPYDTKPYNAPFVHGVEVIDTESRVLDFVRWTPETSCINENRVSIGVRDNPTVHLSLDEFATIIEKMGYKLQDERKQYTAEDVNDAYDLGFYAGRTHALQKATNALSAIRREFQDS